MTGRRDNEAGRGTIAAALLAPLLLYGTLLVIGAGCAAGQRFSPDVLARDRDADGIPDEEDAGPADHDNDGKDDAVDSDDDNDGAPDDRDDDPRDHDNDGAEDRLDPDDDGDGVLDDRESRILDHDNDDLPDAEDGDDRGAAEPHD